MESMLIQGLAAREAAAVEVLCRMSWPDMRCIVRKDGLLARAFGGSADEEACRLMIVDVDGVELGEAGDDGQARLHKLLGGRSAVALHGGNGATLTLPGSDKRQKIVWLSKPYRSNDLRAAIDAIRRSVENLTPLAAGSGRHTAAPLQVGTRGAAEAHALGKALAARTGAGSCAIDALFDAIPLLGTIGASRLMRELSQHPGPQCVDVGSASLVIDYRAGWMLASVIQPSALLLVLKQQGLIASIRREECTLSQLHARMAQMSAKPCNGRRPVDGFLWEMLSHALVGVKLAIRKEFRIRLRRFPNFTELPSTTPIDIRLAVVCARAPQSIRSLRAAFPQHADAVVRFAVLGVAAGFADIIDDPSGTASEAPPRALRAATSQRRSFLQLFLKRLT